MSKLKPWCDTVVAELHAVRASLAVQFHNDLHAYTKAAEARCVALGLMPFSDKNDVHITPKLTANVARQKVMKQ